MSLRKCDYTMCPGKTISQTVKLRRRPSTVFQYSKILPRDCFVPLASVSALFNTNDSYLRESYQPLFNVISEFTGMCTLKLILHVVIQHPFCPFVSICHGTILLFWRTFIIPMFFKFLFHYFFLNVYVFEKKRHGATVFKATDQSSNEENYYISNLMLFSILSSHSNHW